MWGKACFLATCYILGLFQKQQFDKEINKVKTVWKFLCIFIQKDGAWYWAEIEIKKSHNLYQVFHISAVISCVYALLFFFFLKGLANEFFFSFQYIELTLSSSFGFIKAAQFYPNRILLSFILCELCHLMYVFIVPTCFLPLTLRLDCRKINPISSFRDQVTQHRIYLSPANQHSMFACSVTSKKI